jgi:hypothetical protein
VQETSGCHGVTRGVCHRWSLGPQPRSTRFSQPKTRRATHASNAVVVIARSWEDTTRFRRQSVSNASTTSPRNARSFAVVQTAIRNLSRSDEGGVVRNLHFLSLALRSSPSINTPFARTNTGPTSFNPTNLRLRRRMWLVKSSSRQPGCTFDSTVCLPIDLIRYRAFLDHHVSE